MINVVFSVNESWLKHSKDMLFSLCSNTSEHVNAYFLSGNISKEAKEDLIIFINNMCGANVTIIDVSSINQSFNEAVKEYVNNKLSIGWNMAPQNFYKLFIPYVVPESKVLWLDSDVVVKKDISVLYNRNTDFAVTATIDAVDVNEPVLKESLKVSSHYFNSGVMLLNLDKMRAMHSFDDVMATSIDLMRTVKYADQDILNALYHTSVDYFANNEVFNNFMRSGGYEQASKDAEDAYIIHFLGGNKPWEPHQEFYGYYWDSVRRQRKKFDSLS